MLILGIIVFLVIKLFFSILLTKKKTLQYLKDFTIANLSSLTASVLMFFFIHWLRRMTGLRFSASKWSILAAFTVLVVVESIFYCKFDKERKKHEIVLIVILINFLAVILSSPFFTNTAHTPDKAMLRISCISHLKQIGLSLKQYAMDYDGWLPDGSGAAGFEKLRSNDYLTDYEVYHCPSSNATKGKGNQKLNSKIVDYIYRAGLQYPPGSGKDASKIPVVWDKPTNHKDYGNVLFLDGHVMWFYGKDWIEQAGIKETAPNEENDYEI